MEVILLSYSASSDSAYLGQNMRYWSWTVDGKPRT
jgi:hypothetical protein